MSGASIKKIGPQSFQVVEPLSEGFHETLLVDGGYVFADHIKHDPSGQRVFSLRGVKG
jgi:hypothetical protein